MGRFVKNVFKLSVGNLAAQIISIAAVPIITRLYSPEDYGHFVIFLSITSILYPISSFRFNYALMLPTEIEDSTNLYGLSIISVVVFSITTSVFILGIILFGGFFDINSSDRWYVYVIFVPLCILMMGLLQSTMFFALKGKSFGGMAIARISESITDRLFVISVGFFSSLGAMGLIGGRLLGPAIALCYLVQHIIVAKLHDLWRIMSVNGMIRVAKRYREYHLLSTLSLLISKTARETPVLLIAYLFSPQIAGFYGLSMRVTNIPINMIGNAISKVLFQGATEKKENEIYIERITTRLFGNMICLSLPFVLLIVFFGEDIFIHLFGEKWADAGNYSQILILSFFTMFLYRPLSVFFDVYERQRAKVTFDSFLLFSRSTAILWGAYVADSIYQTLFALAMVTAIVYLTSYVYLFNLIGVKPSKLLLIAAEKISLMAPTIIGLTLTQFFIGLDGSLIMVFVLLMVFATQALILLKFDPELKDSFFQILPIKKKSKSIVKI